MFFAKVIIINKNEKAPALLFKIAGAFYNINIRGDYR